MKNLNLDETLLNHIERLIILNRDYISKPSKALKTQYAWFMDRVDEMYDWGWINIETYSKAMMGIEYLMKLNKETKRAKKKN